jgi:hypothetical protein
MSYFDCCLCQVSLASYGSTPEKEKPLQIKNQAREFIHQKYKANENTSRHNSKKKQKANNQQKKIR